LRNICLIRRIILFIRRIILFIRRIILFICFSFLILSLNFNFLYAQPKINLSKAYWDFGTVSEGQVLKETLEIRNTGDKVLNVRLRTSCDCLTTSFSEKTINSQSSVVLTLTFDTKDYQGRQTKYVFIDSDDPDHPNLTWLIEGNIYPSPDPQWVASPIEGEDRGEGEQIHLIMFYAPGCNYCFDLKQKTVPELADKLNINVVVDEYRLDEPDNYKKLLSVEKMTGVYCNDLPVLIIGEKVLSGKKDISGNLQRVLVEVINTGTHSSSKIEQALEITASPEIRSLKLLPVLFAGLVDGINPCAFAGIIFLITYLATIRNKSAPEIFWTGVMYIIGVFIVYFLIGLGFLKIFQLVQPRVYISKIMYVIIAVICFILAVVSFWDFYKTKRLSKGEKIKLILQLPESLKTRIYNTITKYGKLKYLIPIGLILGILVSVFEFFCTGQIYFPTIMYIVGVPELRFKGIVLLILYCSAFVLPLIGVFGIVLFGAKSETLERIWRQHISTVKFAMGVLFLVLSAVLITIVM